MNSDGLSASDVALLSGNNGNNNGWGGDWMGMIALFFLFSMFGWGGFGGWGGGFGDYDNGNSYRRGRSATTGRYVHRPNYSRLSGDDTDMDKYREHKREYSNSRDEGSKGRMLDALEDFMCGLSSMVKQICRDADCREEREIVKKYAREIAEM